MPLLQTIGWFLLALTLLVFVHELGHYAVARWFGVRVLKFSIGFGPVLLRWHVGRDRTEWALSAVPLGGYVKMLDEREDPEAVRASPDADRAFSRKPLWQRSLIVAAGPAANFLLAILLYAGLNLHGTPEPVARLAVPPAGSPAALAGINGGERVVAVDGSAVRSWNQFRLSLLEAAIGRRTVDVGLETAGGPRTVQLALSLPADAPVDRDYLRQAGIDLAPGAVRITGAQPETPAERAGLRAGDEVISVDGQPSGRSAALVDAIRARPGEPMRFGIRRGELLLDVEITPEPRASDRPGEEGRTIGRIGAGLSERLEMVEVQHGPVRAFVEAGRHTWDMSIFSLRMLGKMIVGELSWQNLSGPVAIADYAGQSARVGWQAYLSFIALISVSLGVLNLLPVPVLDGGHLVYYGLEAALRRPLPERFVEVTQKVGLAIVGAMMFLALFNDIARLIGS
jgi:regulator of sigma E protease